MTRSSDLPTTTVRRIRVYSPITLAIPLALLTLWLFMGVFGPWLAPHDPGAIDLDGRLTPPAWQSGGSWEHPLGTDGIGRDYLSRMLHGTRVSLFIVGTVVPLTAVIGTTTGLLSAWFGGWISRLIMGFVDIQMALPGILVLVLFASIFGPSLRNLIIVLVFFGWVGQARMVRSEALALAETDFALAALAIGATDARVMFRHILPNLLNTVVIIATLSVGSIILAEAALSFLGLGASAETISWGKMIADGRGALTVAWWLVTIPGIAIIAVVLAGNLFGDWVRDALDPSLRHAR